MLRYHLYRIEKHLRIAQSRLGSSDNHGSITTSCFSFFSRSTHCTCVMPVLWKRPLMWLSAWCPNTLKRPSSSVPCTPSLWSPYFFVLPRYLRYYADDSVISTTSDSYTQGHIKWLRVKIYDTISASFLLGSLLATAGLLSNRKLTQEQNLTCGPSWVSCTKKLENVRQCHSWQVWNIL